MAASTQTDDSTPTAEAPPLISERAHEIQLRYKLASPTFKTLCTINQSPSRYDVLKKACFAAEFQSYPIKPTERNFFREANDHTAIPYPIKESISQPWHKVFLLAQIELLKTGWPNKLSAAARMELRKERPYIFRLLDRLMRCLADILGERNDGKGLVTALDVLRSLKGGVWEGSEKQLLQVQGIGPVKMDRLFKAGVKSIKQLANLEFYHIERILSRNPPFGQDLKHQLAGFPLLTLDLEVLGQHVPTPTPSPDSNSSPLEAAANGGQDLSLPMWIVRVVVGYENAQLPSWNKKTPWTTLAIVGDNGRLVWFWRGSLKRLVDDKELIIGLNAKKGEELNVSFACEEIVGTMLRETLRI